MLCAKVTGILCHCEAWNAEVILFRKKNFSSYEIATLLSVARNDKAEPFFYVVLASSRFGT